MARRMTLVIPTLTTDRLTLRGPTPDDFDVYADFMIAQNAAQSAGSFTRHTAWLGFAADLGHWLLRGYGFWIIEEKSSGRPAGMVGFFHPEGWPEAELGWTLFTGFEGQGYATEAARRIRAYAYDDLGWGPLASIITPDNTRSIRLAEKLGATFEREWTTPTGNTALIYRHPGPGDQP